MSKIDTLLHAMLLLMIPLFTLAMAVDHESWLLSTMLISLSGFCIGYFLKVSQEYKKKFQEILIYLFSAKILCVLICSFLGFILLSKSEYMGFSRVASANLLAVANLFEWSNKYIAKPLNFSNPLSHLWLISILIQGVGSGLLLYLGMNYLKIKNPSLMIFMLLGFVFVLSQTSPMNDTPAARYLPPFRLQEFYVSFLIGYFGSIWQPKNVVKLAIPFIAIALYFVSIRTSYLPANLAKILAIFLSYFTFLTAIQYVELPKESNLYKFSKIILFTGLALFLLTPLIKNYAQIFAQTNLNGKRYLLVLAVSIPLASTFGLLISRLNILRKLVMNTRLTACLFLFWIGLGGFQFLISKTQGFESRIHLLANVNSEIRSYLKSKECQDGLGICGGKGNTILIGDAHIEKQYKHMLALFLQKRGLTLGERKVYHDCMPVLESLDRCKNNVNKAIRELAEEDFDTVVLAGNWLTALRRDSWIRGKKGGVVGYDLWRLRETLAMITSAGRKVIVLGYTPQLTEFIANQAEVPIRRRKSFFSPAMHFSAQSYVNSKVASIAKQYKEVVYLNVFDLLCQHGRCKVGEIPYRLFDSPNILNSKNLGSIAIYQWSKDKIYETNMDKRS